MQQYLLLGRGIELPPAKMKGTSVRASIEQLSRDPTVKATYGFIQNGNVQFALLCEVPSLHDAAQLAAMARVYGLPNVEVLPLVPPEDLRVVLDEAERYAKAVAALAPSRDPELSLHYQQAV